MSHAELQTVYLYGFYMSFHVKIKRFLSFSFVVVSLHSIDG